MGKPTPIKAPVVDTKIPASKKGKREAEENLGKLPHAKKQKTNNRAQRNIGRGHVVVKTQKKEKEESDYSSSDEEESPPNAMTTKNIPAPVATKPASSGSSYESGSEESSDDDDKDTLVKASDPNSDSGAVGKKVESIGSFGDSDSKDDNDNDKEKDVETVDSKTPGQEPNDVKISPETPINSEAHSITAMKTIYIGNLPFEVERADVEGLFKDVGEVVDVRIATDSDKRFKGYGHVEFATVEAAKKALELDRQILGGRKVRVDLAHVKGRYPPPCINESDSSDDKGSNSRELRIFVRGFDKYQSEDEILNLLSEHFKDCGEIMRISIPTAHGSSAIKGIAYLEFKDVDGFKNALELNGSKLQGEKLTIQEARPRNDVSGVQDRRIFVRGFNKSLEEDEIVTSLKEHFKDCGEIAAISIPRHESGAVRGIAYLEFKETDGFYNAFKLDGSNLEGDVLSVKMARPRRRS